MTTTLRPDLPPVPWRLKHRPVVRGYPLPWFVESDDFRVADYRKLIEAVKRKVCYICGGPLGSYKAWCIGPMCSINRTISEPPGHRECAEWSIQACPFLNQREKKRRANDLPDDYSGPAGIAITRQPGAACLWIAKSYRIIRVEADGDIGGGILFKLGEPTEVKWYREGRQATRAEVLESIESGYPLLMEAAEQDGPQAVKELAAMCERAMALLPKE